MRVMLFWRGCSSKRRKKVQQATVRWAEGPRRRGSSEAKTSSSMRGIFSSLFSRTAVRRNLLLACSRALVRRWVFLIRPYIGLSGRVV